MEKIATENLFLLEFLVDSVNLDPKCNCAIKEGERCVTFQFLDNAPLDVCEEDFTPPAKQEKQEQNEKDSLKSGKSCLFSLSPDQANAAIKTFDIHVTIFKRMPAGWLPERVEVGEALISIANLFSELISSVESSDGSTPTAKTLKDNFVINSSKGEAIGKIGVYIRMSCFGKLIVTQFQMNLEDKSVLFKDKAGKSLYRYKKAGKGGKGESCTPRMAPSGNNMVQNQFPGMAVGPGMMPGNMMPPPCSFMRGPPPGMGMCPALGMGMGPQPGMGMGPQPGMEMGPQPGMGMGLQPGMGMGPQPGMGMGMRMGMGGSSCPVAPCKGQQYSAEQPKPPCQECKEVTNAACIEMQRKGQQMATGANMNRPMTPCIECGNIPNPYCMPPMMNRPMTPCMECGNIPNAPCLPQQSGVYGQMQACPPPRSNTPCIECAGLPNAPCADSEELEGNYQEIGATMGGNTLTIRVHKDKNKVEQVDPNNAMIEDSNDDEGCCCTIGRVGKKGKQEQNFNMRPGVQQGNQDMPFSFKMGKTGNTGNNVVVNPPVATAPDGTKYTEFSDPNKELFILRVGKKNEGIDRKQNLELELCTPRGKVM